MISTDYGAFSMKMDTIPRRNNWRGAISQANDDLSELKEKALKVEIFDKARD